MDSISTGQAKKMLNCTNQTIRNLIREGSIEAVQGDDGRFLVNPESVEAYKRDRDQKPDGNPLDAKSGAGKTNKFAKKSAFRGRAAGAEFGEMVVKCYGSRPDVDMLYSVTVHSAYPVDEFDLETWIETPVGSHLMVDSTPVFALPELGPVHFEQIRVDFSPYVSGGYQDALDYCRHRGRWWWAVRSGGKVVARSADSDGVPGCWQWLERVAERDRIAHQEANPPFNSYQWLRSMPDLLASLASLKGSFSGPGVDPPPSPVRMAVELHQLMNPEEEGGSN